MIHMKYSKPGLCYQVAKTGLVPVASGTYYQGGRVKLRCYKATRHHRTPVLQEPASCPAGNPVLGLTKLQFIKL